MWRKCGGGSGWFCLPPCVVNAVGCALIAIGILMIVVCIPARYWLALIGLVLLALGVYIRSAGR